MDFLQVLFVFVIMSTIIKVAVDNINSIVLPFYDIKKYSMLTAFILTLVTIITYNGGLFEALKVPTQASLQPYFHFVDLIITVFVLTAGANAIHQIVNGLNEYKANKQQIVTDKTK